MEPTLRMFERKSGDEDYKVLAFIGEFDKAGHNDVSAKLKSIVDSLEVNTLVFDFEELKFINSEGIGYVMEIHTHLVTRGKKLVIVSLTDHVQDVFQTIGIAEIIPIFKDLDAYLNQ